jgi:hypothetical protein
MTLSEWAAQHPDEIVAEPTSRNEIRSLLVVVERELGDVNSLVSADRRFISAFWACLTVGRIALRVNGLRPRSTAHHFLVIESLAFTLQLDPDRVRLLQTYRTKRANAEYRVAGAISEPECRAAKQMAQDLQQRLLTWLSAEHPDLAS